MTKVEIKATFIIDLPIESFDEISEPKMTIEESDEFIKNFLQDKFKIIVNKILCINSI